MGRDFKTGLMAGVVLAGAALIWVATRPSLSPQARIARSMQSSVEVEQAPSKSEAGVVPTSDSPPGVPEPERSQGLAGTATSEPAVRQEPSDISSLQSQVSEADSTIYETKEPIKTTRFHIVRKNETLSAISQQYYGSSDNWRKIVAANQRTIKDANRIAPGTKLIIPD